MSNSKLKPDNGIYIKDCIHGHIYVPELCVAFMNVPQFQRLRRVRQLGTAHYAYPSATHSRFEHSLGVMHLAGKMVDQLRKFVEISERTKQLIQLGAMIHDLGHLSYSHLFDMFLEQSELSDDIPTIFKLKNHEDRSLYLLVKINYKLKLLTVEEELFVADIISGTIPRDTTTPYLYQIVCNRECGLDQDKADYLKRDSHHAGFPAFQSDYIILSARIDKDGYLAFKSKSKRDIEDLFATRQRMFENVYQHHTAQKLDKIYICMMRRLGNKIFQYGEMTDDYNIETLLRNSPETAELINCIDTRQLEHECDICKDYKPTKTVKQSGSVNKVRFV